MPVDFHTAAAGCRLCQWGTSHPLAFARAATLHTHPIRPAIHALKYENRVELAPSLARYLIAAAMQPPWGELIPHLDGLVPVPLHPERLQERGFNQARLLADGLAAHTGLPVAESALARVKATRSQVGLTAPERSANVADAFLAQPQVQGQALLLIDDVYTTGATLTAAAGSLRRAGARAVYALALAMPDSQGTAAEAGVPPARKARQMTG